MTEITDRAELVEGAAYKIEGPNVSEIGIFVSVKQIITFPMLTFIVNDKEVHIFDFGQFINDGVKMHIYEYDGYEPGMMKGGRRTRRRTTRRRRRRTRTRRRHR